MSEIINLADRRPIHVMQSEDLAAGSFDNLTVTTIVVRSLISDDHFHPRLTPDQLRSIAVELVRIADMRDPPKGAA